MTDTDHAARLQSVVDQAKAAGLKIEASQPGNLAVISCTLGTKAILTELVATARAHTLAIKWCNPGTMVSIGVPPQKPGTPLNGQESSPETPQSSQ